MNPRSESADGLISISLKTLIDLARPAAGLAQARGLIRADMSGGYVSRFKGRGMEFDETRLYQPGDDLRTIDWKVTARTGKAHTKIFREERERPVFISVDDRAAMHFATRGVFKSVQAAKLAALLAWSAEHHGDRIGGQIFSEQACLELKPQNGKQAVLRLLHTLANRPQPDRETAFAFDQVLARLVKHARPGSLVYIISDFRGLNDASETHLARLAQHCDLQFILVFDVLERQLPEKGRYRFTDGEREVVIDSGEFSRLAEYRQRFEQRLQRLQQIARKKNLKLMLCGTADDPLQQLRNLTRGQ
ncbi:MAG: DUF58 domain-containing protein [Gammaproteobacteria bacterium]